jgi:S1-C subfamily serine protease
MSQRTFFLGVFLFVVGMAFAGTTPQPRPSPTPEVPLVEPSASPTEALQLPEITSNSVLRVNSTNQVYNFFQPWTKKPAFSRRGLGALIEGGRILVTADLVANSNFIELEKSNGNGKSAATVERVDYDCNLAVLVPADASFIEGMVPVPLAKKVSIGDVAMVLQLESNGEIAETSGRISSIAVEGYPMESLGLLVYKLSIPLQQRDGSFTLPAVRDGQLIGMVMRYDARNQSAEIISIPVIEHFLKEVEAPAFRGFPRLGLATSPLRDPQLRHFIGINEPGGVYVSEVIPHASAAKGGLRNGDVILALDGKPLDADGNYNDPDYGRILFSHLSSTLAHPGDTLVFKIFREGKTLEIPVTMEPLDRSRVVSEAFIADRAPKYVILGGLVFIELSRPFLREWGGDWLKSAPQRLVYYDTFQNELPKDRGKIIILAQVLPSPDTIGYTNLENLVVKSVNGRPIKSLENLVEAARHPEKGFQKIEFEEDPKLIFLDAASIQANREALIKHYALPALERL